MGFKKTDIVGEVTVKLTYPNLYKNKDGSPIVFGFTFRRQKQIEADKKTTEGTKEIDTFTSLLTEAPTGFEDFPKDESPLIGRVKEYFSTDGMEDFVSHSLEQYWRAVLPAELFRSL